jgi:EF-P beta-lysylation protein EpmB
MIAASSATDHNCPPSAGSSSSGSSSQGWQALLRQAITDPAELLHALALGPEWLQPARRAAATFGLKVPRGFVARMRKGDPVDPLLLQVLPLHAELEHTPGYVGDPVGDLASTQGAGVLHKYDGRALLITTGACAVHCRYCFRREFPYAGHLAAATHWQPALQALAADDSIHEIILSGGDPLSLADHKLQALTDGLRTIRHIRRLRIHTRHPIVLPERIDAPFLQWLRALPWPVVIVVHANHANEIDVRVEQALRDLTTAGATLLNQSVLLKRINDTPDAHIALSEKLFTAGVLPCYLHLLDPVRGAAHFDVDAPTAAHLMRAIATRLPGYLVPRLVREHPGAPYKTPVHW